MRCSLKRSAQLAMLTLVVFSLHLIYWRNDAFLEEKYKPQSLGEQHGDKKLANFRQEPVQSPKTVRTSDIDQRVNDLRVKREVEKIALPHRKNLQYIPVDNRSPQLQEETHHRKTNLSKFSKRVYKSRATTLSMNSVFRKTDLTDVFFSVKTTGAFHSSRLSLLLNTWVMFVKDQTYFFTDKEDPDLNRKLNGHLINTQCQSGHTRSALCCKMAVEYDVFMESQKRWFCHVDDDTYVNVPKLLEMLQNYNHTDDWYIGKPSMGHPLEIEEKDHIGHKIAFWFATGGAGFCISRGLALKMLPHAGGGRLNRACEKIRLPDDCTVGYIIGHILKTKLTVIQAFHSHLEGLQLLNPLDFRNQVTFSYSTYGSRMNVVNVKGFDKTEDPTSLKMFFLLTLRWFCHVDDDTYVNVPKLLEMLQNYNHTDDWYIGKPSMGHPLEIEEKDHIGHKIAFWFATGGAGFCISRGLALKMMPHAGGGRLNRACEKIRLPDDCTVGYIIGHILKTKLTVIQAFHSHLEGLQLLNPLDFRNQVTFSYSTYGSRMNVVNVKGFDKTEDPTRLKSIHCHLFPYLKDCDAIKGRRLHGR
ncbi:beta-1,3-N-acetylglucosaminyltransferase lunatic fringe [Lingula anatina]|uniref:Beta-1,3-N-acetylglucosaminyltransferase lunatic fringe n=1 Tax=Lingula anatina TaxID=7574 RepID=A0A1S3IZ34_LINAN|nr:beta-1,3-N-acetylglucosaminyltransferase lunatic fringe [Lingula anatina]|eukprot:XP_013402809.1 beta-1,3-N-acetylglucosaminyltransferase lunatic fringe [Lingula anatina]